MPAIADPQTIREFLEDAIVNGQYSPGDKLDPVELSQEFGCSRTPIREALQALEHSGLVEIRPKRGTFVTLLSLGDLVERFEVMAELEGMAAKLATRAITTELLEQIEQALIQCEKFEALGDPDGYYHANASFHGHIYEASANTFLVSTLIQLRRSLQPYRRIQLRAPNRMRRSLKEHRKIYDAIRSGEENDAAEHAEQHVLVQVEEFGNLRRAWMDVTRQAAQEVR